MRCKICSENKLSKEFIPYSMTSLCTHPCLMCLRCATRAAKLSGKCPYENCGQPVAVNSDEISEFNAILDCLFSEVYPLSDDLPPPVGQSAALCTINIVMLTGDCHVLPLYPNHTVSRLKSEIARDLNVPVEKQKLLYNEQELKVYRDMQQARLSDYNIQANSSIFLLVLLYSLPSSLKHVTFDLSWNYPHSGRDYLDATCLVYAEKHCVQCVDYRHTYMAPDSAVTYGRRKINERGDRVYGVYVDQDHRSINHTGDHMNDFLRQGKHTIDVYIDRLPSNVTNLFFVLSAWKHPTIAHFPNPTLNFYEKSKPGVNLCETTFHHARHSSAVIMCSLSRKDGQWGIIGSGALSNGNAKNYEPLKTKIRQLIAEGIC